MKTTNLICNVCKKTEVIDSSPYGAPPPPPGWSHVSVMQSRPPAPTKKSPMEKGLKRLAREAEDADQDEMAKAFVEMAQGFAEDGPGFATPSQQSADICPACAPKALAALLPHLVSDNRPTLVGAL